MVKNTLDGMSTTPENQCEEEITRDGIGSLRCMLLKGHTEVAYFPQPYHRYADEYLVVYWSNP